MFSWFLDDGDLFQRERERRVAAQPLQMIAVHVMTWIDAVKQSHPKQECGRACFPADSRDIMDCDVAPRFL